MLTRILGTVLLVALACLAASDHRRAAIEARKAANEAVAKADDLEKIADERDSKADSDSEMKDKPEFDPSKLRVKELRKLLADRGVKCADRKSVV